MNVVKEIQRINERELKTGTSGSWHDQYKDSAYIFIGGLPYELTEGDVITIFSQYGEVLNVNLPRDKGTGKTRGFGFLMYEDQRSTILAVDNLNGASVLGRTLRVDHVTQYKQTREKGEDGEWRDPEDEQLNAAPPMIQDDDASEDSDVSNAPSIDPEDPMRDWLLAKRKEDRAAEKEKKGKKKRKREDETPEERKARKERKREKKEKKGKVEDSDTKDGRRAGVVKRSEESGERRGSRRGNDVPDRETDRRGERPWNGREDGRERGWERDVPRDPGRSRDGMADGVRPRSPPFGGRQERFRSRSPRPRPPEPRSRRDYDDRR